MLVTQLFDEARSVSEMEETWRIARPAYEETFQEGLRVLTRCWNEAEKDGRDVVALLPFHRLLEMFDGVRVLLPLGCSRAAVPLVRAVFECLLAIEYLTEEDQHRRAAAYVVCDVQRSIKFIAAQDPSTDEGRAAASEMAKDRGLKLDPEAVFGDRTAQLAALKSVLAAPQFAEAAGEYERLAQQKRKGGAPKWHALFGGPRSLRELAGKVGRPYQYRVLYGPWSATAHAEDLHRIKRTPSAQGPPVYRIRGTGQAATLVGMALLLATAAYARVLDVYRPGERNIKGQWFTANVHPVIQHMKQVFPKFIQND